MVGLIIGAILMTGFFFLYDYTKKKEVKIKWWQWLITVAWFAYTAFVLKMAESFVFEGAYKAALVMGLIFGFFSVLGAVLIGRFIFFKKSRNYEQK